MEPGASTEPIRTRLTSVRKRNWQSLRTEICTPYALHPTYTLCPVASILDPTPCTLHPLPLPPLPLPPVPYILNRRPYTVTGIAHVSHLHDGKARPDEAVAAYCDEHAQERVLHRCTLPNLSGCLAHSQPRGREPTRAHARRAHPNGVSGVRTQGEAHTRRYHTRPCSRIMDRPALTHLPLPCTSTKSLFVYFVFLAGEGAYECAGNSPELASQFLASSWITTVLLLYHWQTLMSLLRKLL